MLEHAGEGLETTVQTPTVGTLETRALQREITDSPDQRGFLHAHELYEKKITSRRHCDSMSPSFDGHGVFDGLMHESNGGNGLQLGEPGGPLVRVNRPYQQQNNKDEVWTWRT